MNSKAIRREGNGENRHRDCSAQLHSRVEPARRRARIHERGHRSCADRRGARDDARARRAASRVSRHSARESRDLDGAGILRRQRQACRGPAARHGGHGERDLRSHERTPQLCARVLDRGAHAVDAGRPHRLAQCADPLGAGQLRSGRARPRVHEVGQRAARRPERRRAHRPRDLGRDDRAARTGLFDAAARAARRARCERARSR